MEMYTHMYMYKYTHVTLVESGLVERHSFVGEKQSNLVLCVQNRCARIVHHLQIIYMYMYSVNVVVTCCTGTCAFVNKMQSQKNNTHRTQQVKKWSSCILSSTIFRVSDM